MRRFVLCEHAATRFVVADVETTGLDVAAGHRIVEVAAVELIGRSRTGRHFHSYVNPGRAIPSEATAIHGITDEMVASAPPFSQIAPQLIDFISDDWIVFHNADFDVDFLDYELVFHGHLGLATERVLCTMRMARAAFPKQSAALDEVCHRLDIEARGREKHGALIDAELCASVFAKLAFS